jgi:hypothetical protein
LAKTQTVAVAPISNVPHSRSGNMRASQPQSASPGGSQGRAQHRVVIGAAAAVLGAAILIGWLTNWPQQLFGSPPSNVSGPESAVSARARPAAQESSASASSSTASASAAASASPSASGGSSPAAIVQAYFAAINDHDYAQAWQLGGKSTGSSYAAYVGGFDGTAEDTVTIISVSGDEVTAQVAASQTDGTVKDYSGVYMTADGAIVQAQVQQTN